MQGAEGVSRGPRPGRTQQRAARPPRENASEPGRTRRTTDALAFGEVSESNQWTMGLLDFLRRREQVVDHHSILEWDDIRISCRHPSGVVETVRWADLQVVRIRTTSEGPFVDDIFWELIGGEPSCTVPSETPGAKKLLDKLGTLPGFSDEAVVKAMCCAQDAEFLCWRRDWGGQQPPPTGSAGIVPK
jgi:hypothetical protein